MIPDNKPPIHILLVDDDDDFIDYVLRVSSSFNVQISVCRNVLEALAKIKINVFDAFLIDLHLPDGSGFDVIDQARHKSSGPIAAISGVYQDKESFRRLKEDHGVDYVLGKPVYKDQVEKLFSSLVQGKPLQSNPSSAEDKMEKLKERYRQTICDKVDLLSKLVSGVQHHPDQTSLIALSEAVHKIGGSAGSYGYSSVTRICKELEQTIREKLERDEKVSQEWLLSLNQFLNNIKFHFQLFYQEPTLAWKGGVSGEEEGLRNTLFVCDSSEEFLTLLEREKDRFSIQLVTEKDPEKALQMLLSDDFNPRAVLVPHFVPGFPYSGTQWIQLMRKNKRLLPTIFGVIGEVEDFDLRIDLVKEGISHYFIKPISPIVLLETFSSEMVVPNPAGFRVLLLDDDREVCRFIDESLSEVGIETRSIHEPEALFTALEEFVPHLLLLDVLLPRYDGLHLLKALRADIAYKELTVVIITHFIDRVVDEVAYAENATGIIHKPIEKNLLQHSILELARRQAVYGYFHPIRSRTGLRSLSGLNSTLLEILHQPDREERHLTLFDVKNFDDFVLETGRGGVNKFLISAGNLLIGLENHRFFAYFIAPSLFAIIQEGTPLHVFEEKLSELLMKIRSEAHADISLAAAIVPISKDFEDTKEILEAAQTMLKKAKESDAASPVTIEVWRQKKVFGLARELILIDPDLDMQLLVQNALEKQGIEVKLFSNGEEAWDAIHAAPKPPSLVITERKLPDMDGIILLDRLRKRFKQRIPFFFLTLYSSHNDVEEGIKHGASDYLTKPINLNVFIEKVKKIVIQQSPGVH